MILLANRLNSFDYFFAMSDSSKVWDKWSHEKSLIKSDLKTLSVEYMIELKKMVTIDDKMLYRHFSEFRGLVDAPITKSMKSQVFTTAWDLLKAGLVDTMSKALTLAWKRVKVLSALREGVAYFSYKKVSGELREAIGTLRSGNFSYVYKKSMKAARLDVIKYFDIEVRGWRSFRLDRLVTIAA